MLAKEKPNWNLAVSTWGQGDPDHMLWAKDHIKNVPKVLSPRSHAFDRFGNLFKYHTPVPTWTRKFRSGNIKKLIKINRGHFDKFQKEIGNVDIIHAQATYPAAIMAQDIATRSGIPYFVTIRMSPFPFKEFLDSSGDLKSWIREPLEKANGLIATSHSLKTRLREFGFEHVQVVHNPVDTDFFSPLAPGSSFPKEELPDPSILTVGRIVPQKGIDILIKAIARLESDFKGHFRIGGDGEHLKEYQDLARKLKVGDKIQWLGTLSREQVRDEMQRCSYYVLPSRHETFGNVLLEAMACGKPVLATRCGGPGDIVSPETGILCENEDIVALTRALETFNRDNYDSNAIRKTTVEKFGIHRFSNQLTQAFGN